jgi:cytochrome c
MGCWRGVTVTALATSVYVAALGTSTLGQAPAGSRSIWTGVYTAEQAERGQARYLGSCATCHGDDLQGDSAEEIPALASDQFLNGWRGRTVKDLVETIRRTMPGDRPGSLQANIYVDLVAFILKSNRVPAGSEPLPSDPDRIPPILIDSAP